MWLLLLLLGRNALLLHQGPFEVVLELQLESPILVRSLFKAKQKIQSSENVFIYVNMVLQISLLSLGLFSPLLSQFRLAGF